MADQNKIIGYLEEQKKINEETLEIHSNSGSVESDPEIRRMRERERLKLVDRVYELKRHIEAINRM